MDLMKLADIKSALRNGAYAWPGGYPLYFVADDGEALSYDAVRANWRRIVHSHLCNMRDGWSIVGVETNWEDGELTCAHTNERIQSAYAEPDDLAS